MTVRSCAELIRISPLTVLTRAELHTYFHNSQNNKTKLVHKHFGLKNKEQIYNK